MALIGSAAMVAIYDLDDGWETRHDDWHSHEHMYERVGIPGFLRGRRYIADGAGPRCFVLYEADSLDVLTSDAYLERLNKPTPWSSETMPHFCNMMRTLCRVTVSIGHGLGGKMAFVALSPEPAKADDLRRHIEEAFAMVVKQPGVLSAHLLEADDDASRIKTREKELRGNTDKVADWLLLVEGYRPMSTLFETISLAREVLITTGAASVGNVADYSLGGLLAESEIVADRAHRA